MAFYIYFTKLLSEPFHPNLCSLGLANNFTYVVFLSAAQDIVKSSPSIENGAGLILVADVVPSFLAKLVLPYVMHRISYLARILLIMGLTVQGIYMVAFIENITWRLIGIMIASFSSGLGEITFLALCSFYEPSRGIMSFSAGTGAAGVVGSLAYLSLHAWIGFSTVWSLTIVSVVPFLMLYSYITMSKPFLEAETKRNIFKNAGTKSGTSTPNEAVSREAAITPMEIIVDTEKVIAQPGIPLTRGQQTFEVMGVRKAEDMSFREKLGLIKAIVWSIVVPLFFVFWAYNNTLSVSLEVWQKAKELTSLSCQSSFRSHPS